MNTFDKTVKTVPNSETVKAIEDARKGIGLSRGFSSVAELMEDMTDEEQEGVE